MLHLNYLILRTERYILEYIPLKGIKQESFSTKSLAFIQ